MSDRTLVNKEASAQIQCLHVYVCVSVHVHARSASCSSLNMMLGNRGASVVVAVESFWAPTASSSSHTTSSWCSWEVWALSWEFWEPEKADEDSSRARRSCLERDKERKRVS